MALEDWYFFRKIDSLLIQNLLTFLRKWLKLFLCFWSLVPYACLIHLTCSKANLTISTLICIRISHWTTLLHYLPGFHFYLIMEAWWMLGSDFPLVGNICGFHTGTGRCWVACNPWANLRHIVASFHQWHTTAWGLRLLASDFITIFTIFWICLWYTAQLKQVSADKKFGNADGYRLYKRRTRLCSYFLLFLSECILEEKVADINILCCSPLILLPPVVYENLPLWFKATFLFEFPFYSRSLPQEGLNWWD